MRMQDRQGEMAVRKDASRNKQPFAAWSNRVERRIIQAIGILLVLLVFSQMILQIPAVSERFTPPGQTEGIPYPDFVP